MPWTTNQQYGGIFCDTQKAFNCINHDILLPTMGVYSTAGREENTTQTLS